LRVSYPSILNEKERLETVFSCPRRIRLSCGIGLSLKRVVEGRERVLDLQEEEAKKEVFIDSNRGSLTLARRGLLSCCPEIKKKAKKAQSARKESNQKSSDS